MPKTKKQSESESDSDSSGPRDRVPEKKKAKTESSSSKPGSGKSGDASSWDLDKRRVVRINEFKGKVFVDIREMYEDQSGDMKPGKKGISLSVQQYQKLKSILPEVDEALKRY